MEINKYTTYCRGLKDHEEYCLPDDVNKLISYHKAVVKTMQNKIDELEKMNIKFYNCLESTYKYDLPIIDDLCDIAGVHKFTMLRNELEELLAKGIK